MISDAQIATKKENSAKVILAKIEDEDFHPMLSWKDIQNERPVVVDFDYHKISNVELKTYIKNRLYKLIFANNWTAVTTPKDGLHIYFRASTNHICHSRKILQGITRSYITNVDWLGGNHKVMGPNGKDRVILNLTDGELPEMPWYLLPFGNDEKTNHKFLNDLTIEPSLFWTEGYRATGMLKIVNNMPNITNAELNEYNLIWCNPPKTNDDMQITVFNKRPRPLKDILEFRDPLAVGVLYDREMGKYFIYNQQNLYWQKTDLDGAGQKLIIDGIPLEGLRLDNHIHKVLSIKGVAEIRARAEAQLPPNQFPLYFKNRALFLTKNDNNSFELKDIPTEFLKTSFITAYLSKIEYTLTTEQESVFLEKLSKLHNNGDSLSQIVAVLCGEVFSFVNDKANFESKGLTQEITNFLLNLITLIFLKNVKNYNQDLFCKKIVCLLGSGDSGKTTYIKFLSGFVGEDLKAVSDIHRLANGKFETSRFQGTSLNLFPDQDETYGGRVKSLIGKLFSGAMKALSGGDEMASEKKFKDLSEIKNTGLCVVSTNANITLAKATENAYGAMKGRLAAVLMENPRKGITATENFELQLFQNCGAQLAIIMASFESKRGLVLRSIKDYDFENLVYKYGESRLYARKTCSYFGFIYEVLMPKSNAKKIKVDLTITELFGLFYQYSVLRKNNDQPRYCSKFDTNIKAIYNFIEVTDLPDRIQEIWNNEFVVHEDTNKAAGSQFTIFKAKLFSRGECLPGFKQLNWSTINLVVQPRNSITKRFEEKFTAKGMPIAIGVELDLSFLNSLEDFTFPEKISEIIKQQKSVELQPEIILPTIKTAAAKLPKKPKEKRVTLYNLDGSFNSSYYSNREMALALSCSEFAVRYAIKNKTLVKGKGYVNWFPEKKTLDQNQTFNLLLDYEEIIKLKDDDSKKKIYILNPFNNQKQSMLLSDAKKEAKFYKQEAETLRVE